MKMTKMALLAGAALAVTTAGAQADELTALKAQIESLNARVAAMETAPAVPAGYQLIAVSEGDLQQTPGLEMSARDLMSYGTKSTVISVLPTADAPAGTTISWSGFTRAALVYTNVSSGGDDESDIDVLARGQLRVKASTDTAVGEVGVDIRLRGNFNGTGNADVYADVAWGYWAMTPELTFGGGYAGSLGNIGYGYDGACTCEYTDNADLAFNPGDVSQLRLSYASGPVSFAIALEDGSTRDGADTFGASDDDNPDKLGASGEIKYSGDAFSGEVSAVWRDTDDSEVWQIGAGLGFALGDVANLSLAAAMGEVEGSEYVGVTGLASFNLSDEISAEVGAGWKERNDEDFETWGVLAGVYYTPVDQLTIGLEGEYFTEDEDGSDTDTTQFNLVTVWRF